jgi:DNA modification methylase
MINLPTQIELRSVRALLPYARNSRTHSDEQVAQVAASIKEFGWTSPILVDAEGTIIAGHARLLAARKLEMTEVPVIVLAHLTPAQRRALVIADNKLAMNAGWDETMLREEMSSLDADGFDLAVVGFSDEELVVLLAEVEPETAESAAGEAEDEIPEAPVEPVTRPGDIWRLGKHRLICGDCRDLAVVEKLMAGASANVVITSPPYATQREYDPSSGFRPIPPEEYGEWYRDVAANIAAILADDGSYFLNIKEHAADGERHLYVKDLVIAHKRLWGWRFVDEFCWRKTDNGVPGGWGNRFKNAFELIFHFCRQPQIKFRPQAVGHASDDCFDYNPNNPKSTSGSGLLGTGPRGAAADGGKNQSAWQRSRSSLSDDSEGRHAGIARPSNVIEVRTESGQGSHSAPFPRPLVEFFLLAFSDAGDVVCDPFMGSGTTMAAAALLDRVGYGCEISPAYCDVILRRIMHLTGETAMLAKTGETFAAVAESRGEPPTRL